ncbi:MAG: carbohydrate-binding family 9-like protein [Pyrinomonadaceae bacterium]
MSKTTEIQFVADELAVEDVENAAWADARENKIRTHYNGRRATKRRRALARLLWSEAALHALFVGNQYEPLIASENPSITEKTLGLWDRDVFEIFVSPRNGEVTEYFEFEVAPTGEWVDLAIKTTPEGRTTDTGYMSGFESFAKIEKKLITVAMKIPWSAFGAKPNPGDIWRGNLFRCIGDGPERGYLAWSPTFADFPNFHVPARFGEFRFVAK